MKNPYFFIAAGLFGGAILTAALYLGSSTYPTSAVGVNGQTANETSTAIPLSKDASVRGNTAAPMGIGPLEAYSSNPPRQPHEENVLRVALNRELSDGVKIQQLLAMVPRLPPDGQTLALEHAARMIPDADYLKFRPRLLQLANTDDLRETVLLDVLTRDDEIRMLTMVEFLKLPPNNGHAEVREILEAFLEKNYGDDAGQWDLAVRKYLAANAEG